MTFELTYLDGTTHVVTADGYAPDGPLTTFFTVDPGRFPRLDPWAVRVLSVRTDRLVQVRRCGPATGGAIAAPPAAA